MLVTLRQLRRPGGRKLSGAVATLRPWEAGERGVTLLRRGISHRNSKRQEYGQVTILVATADRIFIRWQTKGTRARASGKENAERV